MTGGIPSPNDDSWLEIEELRLGKSPEDDLFRVFWEKFPPGTKLLAHCQFPISKVRLFFKKNLAKKAAKFLNPRARP